MANNDNYIDTITLFDDVLKTSQSARQFGPTRLYRVKEIPSRDFGRNGDLAVIDNTAETTTEITGDLIPTSVSFCQKVPSMVPSGPNSASSTTTGADLIASDEFSIQVGGGAVTTITLPAVGPLFIADAADAINAAAITGVEASFGLTYFNGTVVNPVALPGDSITINGVVVSWPVGATTTRVVGDIKAAGIPFITAGLTGGKLTLSHSRGGTITVVGPSVASLFGAPTITGGILTIRNDSGEVVTLVDVTGTPLATMGFPLTIAASPLIQGGEWECFTTTGGVDVLFAGTSIGNFTDLNFTGPGVSSVVDAGGGQVNITISGGGAGGVAYGSITGDAGVPAVATVASENITFGGTGVVVTTADGAAGLDTVSFDMDISDLPAGAGPLTGTDEIAVNDGGTTERHTINDVVDAALPGLSITTINTQPMLTLEDTTRGNKILSVAEQPLKFAENVVGEGAGDDWLRIANANDIDSGYIMDFDGTLVYATAHCEDSLSGTKDLRLFINATDSGVILTIPSALNATVTDNTLNIDFSQGDRIRVRADAGAGNVIQDTVVKLSVKWRG